MNLTNANQRKLLDELSARKVMLPDIKRVQIQFMNNDSDASVRDFLDSCLPDSLQSLTINYEHKHSNQSILLPALHPNSLQEDNQRKLHLLF
jgi:hypothetical protein